MRPVFLVLSVMLAFAAPAFASHFDFDTTDNNASILILGATLTDRHWGEGDEIGLFTPGGVCAGGFPVGEFPDGVPAWGDDTITEEVDGFVDGDVIRFRGWDASEQEEFPIEVVYILEGDPEWHSNGWIVCELADGGRHFPVHPIAARHRILCSSATIHTDEENRTLEDLDQIGVFTPSGLAAGLLVWDARLGQAVGYAYADLEATVDSLEGFRRGESFSFRYWLRNRALELEPNRIEILRGDSAFRIDGTTEVALEFYSSSVGGNSGIPVEFRVSGPFPNPFNGRGEVEAALPWDASFRFAVYDITGKLVLSERAMTLTRGIHRIALDFNGLTSGVYLARFEAGGRMQKLQIVLLK